MQKIVHSIWTYSLNAIVAQPKNCPFGVNTMIGLKNLTTLHLTVPAHFLVETCPTICHYCQMQLLYFLNSIEVLTQNGQFLDCTTIACSEHYVLV